MLNKPSHRGSSCQHGLLFLVPSSKDSSPTLASKVDQLEGMLKMLREDLKKVNTRSQSTLPGCANGPFQRVLVPKRLVCGGCLELSPHYVMQCVMREGRRVAPLWGSQEGPSWSLLPLYDLSGAQPSGCHCDLHFCAKRLNILFCFLSSFDYIKTITTKTTV